MPRVRLIHWKAEEAAPRIEQLKQAGYEVDYGTTVPPDLLRAARSNPPAAFVIDLTRLPSHGREVALALRQSKSTRFVPLVFAGGEPEKIDRVRQALPDAVFTEWTKLRAVLKKAIAHPPADPHVPGSVMDGYSGTPLPKKLGIKPGSTVALLGAPDDFERTLGDLPEGATLRDGMRGPCDLVLWFLRTSRDLESGIGRMSAATPPGGIWMIWPKKTSGIVSDLSDRVVRATGLAHGLVDFKVCAVDATWSGLKFVRRKQL